jgi:hypothetical protein
MMSNSAPVDHYAPWEWQPIERMPGGCYDVEVKYDDGRTRDYCSCDYWWAVEEASQPIEFRGI